MAAKAKKTSYARKRSLTKEEVRAKAKKLEEELGLIAPEPEEELSDEEYQALLAEGEEDKIDEKFDISENNQYGNKNVQEQLKQVEEFARSNLRSNNKKITKQDVLSDLSKIFGKISMDDALKVYAVALMMNQNPLPKKAPELFKDRTDICEKAPDFIKRVYGDYIGKGLSKPVIRQLDIQLYNALLYWLRSNELPSDLPLPKKSEVIDHRLAHIDNVAITESSDAISAEEAARTVARLQRARERRRTR